MSMVKIKLFQSKYYWTIFLMLEIIKLVQGTIQNIVIPCDTVASNIQESELITILEVSDNSQYQIVNDRNLVLINGDENSEILENTLNIFFILSESNGDQICELEQLVITNQKEHKNINFVVKQPNQDEDKIQIIFNNLQKIEIQGSQTQIVNVNKVQITDSIQGLIINNIDTLNLNNLSISSNQDDNTPQPEFRYSQLQILLTLNVNIDNLNVSNIGGSAEKDEYENIFISGCSNIQIENSNFSGNKGITRIGSSLIIKSSTGINIINTDFSYNSNTLACGGLYIKDSFNVVLDDVQFISNFSNKAGLLATNIQGLEIKNSLFSENLGSYGAAGNLVDVTGLILHKTIIQDTIGFWEPGGLVVENCDEMVVTECTFQRNRVDGWYGGTFYITGSDNIKVIDSTFKDNFTGFQGGSFQLFQSSGELTRVHFENNQSPFKGNVMFLEEVSDILISNCKFLHHTSSTNPDRVSDIGSGFGGINIFASTKIQIIDSIFDDNIAAQGGDINTLDLIELIVIRCTFTNSKATTSFGGSIYVMNSDIVTIEESTFENTEGFNGGALGLQSVDNLKIKDCEFNGGVSQELGGAFWFNQIGVFDGENINIMNYTAQLGAGIYIEQSGITNLINVNINKNNAINFGGGIYLKTQTDFSIKDSQIIENNSYNGSGIYADKNTQIRFDNCEINSNISENLGGGLYFNSNVDIFIDNSNINNNQAISGGGLYFILNSGSVSFKNSHVNENISTVSGGGLYIENDKSVINLVNLNIIGNQAQSMNGGGLFISQSSVMNFKSLQINQNSCGQSGGSIYISRQKSLITGETLYIEDNKSNKNGAGIMIIDSDSLILKSSQVQNNISRENGGALFFSYTDNISLQNINFENHGSYQIEQEINYIQEGGTIYGDNAIHFDIIDSQINKSQSLNKGGACLLTNIENLNIQNTKFTDNFANYYGGALFLENIGNLNIQQDSSVSNSSLEETNNKASGGGIYLDTCQKMEINSFICQDNQGTYKGGCIYIKDTKEMIIIESLFQGNSVLYDINLSQYSKDQNYFTTSGGAIYIEEQKYQENSLKIQDSSFFNNMASSGGSVYIIEGMNYKIKLEFIGEIQFQDNIADVGPGLRFIGDQNNQNNVNQMESLQNKNHSNNKGQVQKEQGESVILGYYFNERKLNDLTYEFDLCPLGTYLNINENVSICQKCIDGAECSGGYIPLVPQKEYWRENTDSDLIVHCYNFPGACVGNDTCLDGHMGILCEECNIELGFTKTRGGECVKCNSNFMVAIGMLLTGLAYIFVQYMSVTSVLKRVNQSVIKKAIIKLWDYFITFENRSSGIYKILIFHFQILYLVVNFDYEIIGFVNGVGNILTDPGTSLTLDFDCFEKEEGYNEEDSKWTKTYHTFYGYALTIGLLFMIFIVFLIKYLTKHISKKAFIGGLVLSTISLFITVQPGFIANSLKSIQCRNIADFSVTLGDSRVNCDEPFYKDIILPINISILSIAGGIIPIILLTILIKINKHKTFHKLHNRRSFGYFYLEFKQETFYWDFILMLQKILIAFATTFYTDQKVIQSAIVILVIFVFMNLTSRKNPYTSKHMTDLLVMSSFAQIVTLTSILCIERSEFVEMQYFKLLGNIIILTVNSIFLLSAFKILVPYVFQNAYGFIYSFQFMAPLMNRIFKKKFERERLTKQNWRKLRNFVKIFNAKKKRKANVDINPIKIYEHIVKDILTNQKYNLDITQKSNILKSNIDADYTDMEITKNNNVISDVLNIQLQNQIKQNEQQPQEYNNIVKDGQNKILGAYMSNSGQTQEPTKSMQQSIDTGFGFNLAGQSLKSQVVNRQHKSTSDSFQIQENQDENTQKHRKRMGGGSQHRYTNNKTSKFMTNSQRIINKNINNNNIIVSGVSNDKHSNDSQENKHNSSIVYKLEEQESRDELNMKSFNNQSQIQMVEQQNDYSINNRSQNQSMVKSFRQGYKTGDNVDDIQFTFPDEEKI